MTKLTIACYYFPNYHPNDSRNCKLKGAGWSEWELVKAAKPNKYGVRNVLCVFFLFLCSSVSVWIL
ncbi:hypothetical protein KAH27_03535 [bacterium]|nr:hypothetical protein [bacterium]